MNELREKTATLHRATETAFDLRASCASLANYSNLLRTLLAVYRPLERRLDRVDWNTTTIDWKNRRKTALLETDLIALREPCNVQESDQAATIPLRSTAGAIGCLYVLEGSTLGGQYILKHIERTLGLTQQKGAAFFAGYGAATRERWASFGAAADAYAGDDAERIADAIDAASWTFSCFEMSFHQARTKSLATM
jgi:heme oxygenase